MVMVHGDGPHGHGPGLLLKYGFSIIVPTTNMKLEFKYPGDSQTKTNQTGSTISRQPPTLGTVHLECSESLTSQFVNRC